jgi:hypothetical protein
MRARALGAGEPRGATDVVREATDVAFIAQERPQAQEQPLERHEPLADDKRQLFAVPAVYRLRGVWQGPGTIAQLRREAQP